MPTHKKSRQLATEFERVYPETLSERLAWWCRILGITRFRLLRMMGLSSVEADNQKNKNWESILKKKEWEENGWWMEGKLHDLLSFFDYDWKALTERLHQTAPINGEKFTRGTRFERDNVERQYSPDADATEVLLGQLTGKGPDSLVALLAYLSDIPLARGHAS